MDNSNDVVMKYLPKIQSFNRDKDVMRLQRMFNDSSILEVVGVERKETRHSKFLEWLFRMPELNTPSQTSPIMHLLDVLLRRDEEQNNLIDRDFRKDVITRKSNIRIDYVKAEHLTTGLKLHGKEGKIDLYIKAYDIATGKTIHICIENKVDSTEHDNQTWKYYAYMTGDEATLSKVGGIMYSFDKDNYQCPTKAEDIILFVFLTPSAEFIMKNKEMRDSMCECDKYIHINYQDIVNEILNPLSEDGATSMAALDKIEQYVCSLGIPGYESTLLSEDDDSKLSITAMAAGTELLFLSQELYKRYMTLLDDAIFPESITDEELKEVLSEFKKGHKRFISNLLCIVELVEEDAYEYYKKKLMTLIMNDKKTNYLVKCRGKYNILSQKEFSIEFAKLYCERKFVHPISNIASAVNLLNNDFESVKGPSAINTLFTMNPSKSNLYDIIDPIHQIYFANNIWGTGNYLNKLESFILNQQVVNKNDFEMIKR